MRGSRRGEDVFPNRSTRHLSQCLFLHRRNSNLGTNLCIVVAKIDELPDWESARLHSRGNNKSLGLPNRRAPWRVACVRRCSPLPCLPHLSSNLSPHHSLPPSIHLPPPIPILSVTAVTSEVVPGCWGPEGTPPLCAFVRACVPGGRKAHTVYSNGKIQSVDSSHLCILSAGKKSVLQIFTCFCLTIEIIWFGSFIHSYAINPLLNDMHFWRGMDVF